MPDAHDIAHAVAAKMNRYENRAKIPEYDHVGQFLSAVSIRSSGEQSPTPPSIDGA